MTNKKIASLLLWVAGLVVASYGMYFLSIGQFAVVDISVARMTVGWHTPFLNAIMFVVTLFGRELLIVLVAVVTAALYLKRHVADALLLVVGMSAAWVLQFVLKIVFVRPRPFFSPITIETTYSFPSGHALAAFVFFGFMALYVFWQTKRHAPRFYALVSATILVLAIGVSRVYLGVHWLSDVLGGYVIGVWLLTLMTVLRPAFVKRFQTLEP
ncbi:MAG: phosphatase PAP2 family protein [Patescibacteria group bacterium]|jgi:undecaprenyl-diphosphatase